MGTHSARNCRRREGENYTCKKTKVKKRQVEKDGEVITFFSFFFWAHQETQIAQTPTPRPPSHPVVGPYSIAGPLASKPACGRTGTSPSAHLAPDSRPTSSRAATCRPVDGHDVSGRPSLVDMVGGHVSGSQELQRHVSQSLSIQTLSHYSSNRNWSLDTLLKHRGSFFHSNFSVNTQTHQNALFFFYLNPTNVDRWRVKYRRRLYYPLIVSYFL